MVIDARQILTRVISALVAGMLLAPLASAMPPDIEFNNDLWQHKDGRRLFIHVLDTVPGQSTCTGACTSVWTTLPAAADAVEEHEWTVERQADGGDIWAYKGKPVYLLIDPLRTTYKATSAEWLLARATQWLPTGVSIDGEGLLTVEGGGMVKTPKSIACDAECKAHWLPLRPATGETGWQDWTVVEAPEGGLLWGYGPARMILYVENPASPPPAILPKRADGVPARSNMVQVRAKRYYAQLDPMTVAPGSLDMHDPSITKAAKLLPGWKPPVYPSASRRNSETGFSVVQLCIGPDGAVTDRKLVRTSDYERLDAAMLAWTSNLQFSPAEVADKPVSVCGYTIDFAWVLE